MHADRIIYEVEFNLNGGYGTTPDIQNIPYGGLLEKAPEPAKKGYNFKGWQIGNSSMEEELWDFERPVEYNTETLHTTLYAKWADELAPQMREASFSTGSGRRRYYCRRQRARNPFFQYEGNHRGKAPKGKGAGKG